MASLLVCFFVVQASATDQEAPPGSSPHETYKARLLIQGVMKDEFALYSIHKELRKIPSLLKVEGAWRTRTIQIEYDPSISPAVDEIAAGVRKAGYTLEEFRVELRGTFFSEGYKKRFRTSVGDQVFQVAEGPRARELAALPPSTPVLLKARIDLATFKSPFILIVISFDPHD